MCACISVSTKNPLPHKHQNNPNPEQNRKRIIQYHAYLAFNGGRITTETHHCIKHVGMVETAFGTAEECSVKSELKYVFKNNLYTSAVN